MSVLACSDAAPPASAPSTTAPPDVAGTAATAPPLPANPDAYRFRDTGLEPYSPFCEEVGAEEYTYIDPGLPAIHKLDQGGYWFIRDGTTHVTTDALEQDLESPVQWTTLSMDEVGTASNAGIVAWMLEDTRPKVDRRDVDAALRRNGLPEPLGTEDVRGIPTTHYRVGLLPTDWYPLALGVRNTGENRLPPSANDIDVWIDEQGEIRRMRGTHVTYTPSEVMGQPQEIVPVSTPIEYEWWAFGEPPPVELPEEDEAVPFRDLPASVLRPDDPCDLTPGRPACRFDEAFDENVEGLTVGDLEDDPTLWFDVADC